MQGKKDKLMGETKEKAGELLGNKELEAEGRRQRAAGHVERVGEKAKDAADKVGDKLKR